jgi:hypothetical protein
MHTSVILPLMHKNFNDFNDALFYMTQGKKELPFNRYSNLTIKLDAANPFGKLILDQMMIAFLHFTPCSKGSL